MPRKITKDTHGLTEQDICTLGNADLKAKASILGLTEIQLEDIKKYRRLLKVRCYGKSFRTKERSEINQLKKRKDLLKQEQERLHQEIYFYQTYLRQF